MKYGGLTIDWEYLRRSLPWLAAAVIISLVVGITIWRLTAASNKDYLGKRQQRDAIRQDYELTMQTRDTINKYQADFQALEISGLIGDESRLAWVEQVESIAAALKLPGVAITMQPQTSLPAEELPALTVPTLSSVMKLQLRLFHEGDLLVMLEALKKHGPGIFWVRSCALKRKESGETVEQLRQEGTVEAQCELLWLTLASAPLSEALNVQ